MPENQGINTGSELIVRGARARVGLFDCRDSYPKSSQLDLIMAHAQIFGVSGTLFYPCRYLA